MENVRGGGPALPPPSPTTSEGSAVTSNLSPITSSAHDRQVAVSPDYGDHLDQSDQSEHSNQSALDGSTQSMDWDDWSEQLELDAREATHRLQQMDQESRPGPSRSTPSDPALDAPLHASLAPNLPYHPHTRSHNPSIRGNQEQLMRQRLSDFVQDVTPLRTSPCLLPGHLSPRHSAPHPALPAATCPGSRRAPVQRVLAPRQPQELVQHHLVNPAEGGQAVTVEPPKAPSQGGARSKEVRVPARTTYLAPTYHANLPPVAPKAPRAPGAPIAAVVTMAPVVPVPPLAPSTRLHQAPSRQSSRRRGLEPSHGPLK